MESDSDTNIPQGEQSAYKLFESEQLDVIKNEHPDWNQKEVISAIQIRWKELEKTDKKDQLRKFKQIKDEDRKEDISLNETNMQVERSQQQQYYFENENERLKLTDDQELNNNITEQSQNQSEVKQQAAQSTSNIKSNLFEVQPLRLNFSISKAPSAIRIDESNKKKEIIQNIISSKSLSDQVKSQQLKYKLEELKNKDYYQILQIFQLQLQIQIFNYIGTCSTKTEKVILEIIELIVNKGELQYEQNYFLESFSNSGILNKIETQIKEKVKQEDKENENKSYSEIIEQLVKIYLKIMKRQKIDSEMKDYCGIVLDRSISNILGTWLLSEEEKEKETKKFYEEIKNKNYSELINIFDSEMLIIILNRIGNCTTSSEKVILDIIEIIMNKENQQEEQNSFFESFSNSGLINKIETQIIEKVKQENKENENKSYSEIIKQLVRIYLKIMKRQKIDSEMINYCGKVLDRSTSNILGTWLLSEKEKEIKAKTFYEEIQNKNQQDLREIFDYEMLLIILNRIGNCSTSSEKMILDIIELIVNYGEKQFNQNTFFQDFFNSELLIKIESLIIEKVKQDDKENENKPYSEIIEQLVRVYLKIMKGLQINSKMMNIRIKILDKSISNILGSNLLSEKEKEIKAKTFYEQMKNKKEYELQNIFDQEMIVTILKRFGNCSTTSEKVIFDIVELIINKGEQQYEQNSFFYNFSNSGLLNKIETQIKEKIQLENKENENKPYSEIIEQLVRVYLKIMKRQKIDSEMIDYCGKVLDRSISNILGSNLLSEKEKKIKAKTFYEQITKKNQQELTEIFDYEMLLIILNRIGNCSTASEKVILDIIELIVNYGEKQFNQNTFFQDFFNSGLLIKIESLIIEKVKQDDKENENKPYSEIIEQLVRVYLKIMKGLKIESEMIDFCGIVLDRSVSNILGSNLLSEEEIEIKTQKFFEKLKNMNQQELTEIFDNEMLLIILNRIENCSSKYQKTVIEIIELIANNGEQYQVQNLFFTIFSNSGLLNKIVALIKQNVEQEDNENNNKPYSNIFMQLIYIYQKIMKKQKQLNEKINQLCKRVINQKSSSIFGSQSLSEEGKELKYKSFYEELKLKDLNQLKVIFFGIFPIIKQNIGNCQTLSERMILNILEYVSGRGIINGRNAFKEDFERSCLQKKIQQLIEYKDISNKQYYQNKNTIYDQELSEEENKENNNEDINQIKLDSNVRDQLILIYLYMDDLNNIDSNMIKDYGKALKSKISQLLDTFKQLKEKLNNEISIGDDNYFENELEKGRILIKTAGQIQYCKDNNIYRFHSDNIPSCIIDIFNSEVISLLTLTFETLKSSHQINICLNQSIMKLQNEIFYTYLDLLERCIFDDYQFYGIFDPIFPDISQILNDLAPNQLSIEKTKMNKNELNPIMSSSFSFKYISFALNILHKLLWKNYNNCLKASSIPNLISTIYKLCIFNIEILISDKEGLEIEDIKWHSYRNLGWIQCHGDNDAQSQLCKLGYAGMMAVAVGICGGSIVNNNLDIKSALSSIGCFFSRIHEGRQIYKEEIDDHISFPPQPELIKPSEEQFEEEGGNEEIEALLINKGRNKFDDDSINVRAIRAKYDILNSYIDKQNKQIGWYEYEYYFNENRNQVLKYNGDIDDENLNNED